MRQTVEDLLDGARSNLSEAARKHSESETSKEDYPILILMSVAQSLIATAEILDQTRLELQHNRAR
jgi:hypothetical protein